MTDRDTINQWVEDTLAESEISQAPIADALATSGLLDHIATQMLMINRLLHEIADEIETVAPQLQTKLEPLADPAEVAAFMINWNTLPDFLRTTKISVENTVGIAYVV